MLRPFPNFPIRTGRHEPIALDVFQVYQTPTMPPTFMLPCATFRLQAGPQQSPKGMVLVCGQI
jgi:hypothetical protein